MHSCLSFLFVLVPLLGEGARGADWVTFGHDNQRTRVTDEEVRPPLGLRWVFRSPALPAPGWARPVNGYSARTNQSNANYDDAFRIIPVGERAYFVSSAENKVFAIEAACGTKA